MSVKLSAFVWDGCASAGMKLSAVAVMARLADFSSDDGVCWPSIETIARQLGAGESTVRTTIAKLEKEGWLSRKQRRNGNRNASNMYQLNIEKLWSAANTHLSVSDTSKSDASKFEGSKSEASENRNQGSFDPSESGGDPSVNSKQDPSDKKPSGQSAAQPDPEVILTDLAKQVLSHLNMVTGARYQVSKTSLENIRARLGEGFTVDELSLTVDYLNAKWGADLDMAEYLRPVTLFQPSKFPGYLEGAKAWDNAGRPTRKDGKWIKANGEAISGDNTERDAAYRRFIGSALQIRNPSELERAVRTEAGQADLRRAGASFAISRWNAIWKECAQRKAGGKEA